MEWMTCGLIEYTDFPISRCLFLLSKLSVYKLPCRVVVVALRREIYCRRGVILGW